MLTKKRTHGRGQLRESVRWFLDSGEIELQAHDNPWMKISLMAPEAREARELWGDGEEAGALAALARCPGQPNWFLD